MAILYVAADKMELQPFAARLNALRTLKWPLDYAVEGILDGKRMILVANGAGPKLAERATEIAIRALTSASLSASKVEAIVSTGFCGALDPALRENTIVLGTELICADQQLSCEMVYAAPEPFATGPLVCQDRIATSAEEKATLYAQRTHPSDERSDSGTVPPIAVDMESAGVAGRASRSEIPFFCIKVVSDRADESFAFDLNKMRSSDGHIARGKIVTYALAHPKQVAGLLTLKRRGESAAKVLGEFLVSSRILPDSADGTVE